MTSGAVQVLESMVRPRFRLSKTGAALLILGGMVALPIITNAIAQETMLNNTHGSVGQAPNKGNPASSGLPVVIPDLDRQKMEEPVNYSQMSQAELAAIAKNAKAGPMSLVPELGKRNPENGSVEVTTNAILLDKPVLQRVTVPGIAEFDGVGSTYVENVYVFNVLMQDGNGNYVYKQVVSQTPGWHVLAQKLTGHEEPFNLTNSMSMPDVANKIPPNTKLRLRMATQIDHQKAVDIIKLYSAKPYQLEQRLLIDAFALIEKFGGNTTNFMKDMNTNGGVNNTASQQLGLIDSLETLP